MIYNIWTVDNDFVGYEWATSEEEAIIKCIGNEYAASAHWYKAIAA